MWNEVFDMGWDWDKIMKFCQSQRGEKNIEWLEWLETQKNWSLSPGSYKVCDVFLLPSKIKAIA